MSRVEKNKLAGKKGGEIAASRMTAEQRSERGASGGNELAARYGSDYFRNLRRRVGKSKK